MPESIQWDTGTSSCSAYPILKNTIYKSTDPVFIPGPSNQLATCLNGMSFTDNNVISATSYYHIAKAEDSKSGGGGACNRGNIDKNLNNKRRKSD